MGIVVRPGTSSETWNSAWLQEVPNGRASEWSGAVNTGDIPTIRIGRRILVPKAALHRLVAGEPPTLGGSAPA
jgi:hypothetical protein